jgi:hypothetical protein
MKIGNSLTLVSRNDSSSAIQVLRWLTAVSKRVATVLLLGLSLGLSGCWEDTSTGDIASPAEMGTKLNKSLPKGTSIEVAKEYMTKQGFTCEPKTDAVWKRKPHINYLLCKREDGTPPIKRLWEAAVIHDGTSVLAVDLRSALMYP